MFTHPSVCSISCVTPKTDRLIAPPPPSLKIRFNTKVCYTQNKYNLIREDSEGYAKLVACLNHSGEGALTEATVPAMFREIQVSTLQDMGCGVCLLRDSVSSGTGG